MKNYLPFYVMTLVILVSTNTFAQVGVGTDSPDPSSILDLYSKTRGLLMPRLTAAERDLIDHPANGLMIYNTTSNDGELNIGTPEVPIWAGMKPFPRNEIESVTEGGMSSTTSTEDIIVPGMTLSPLPGTYLLLFNGQMSSIGTTFSSDQGLIDVNAVYNELINLPADDSHGLVFGTGEILTPGIYDVTGAASIGGTLTLDGAGNPNSVFIIRSSGAFTTGAGAIVELINGATANNVFWISEGAMSTAAGTIMKGTLVSHANAVSLGANTNLEGRMFTTAGSVTMGASSYLAAPSGASFINLGVLSTFVMFSGSGAISGCSGCGIIGDVGTAAGAATSFDSIDGTVYLAGTTSTPIATTITYTIFLDGSEVANSVRTFSSPSSNVTLQALVAVATGEAVEIRWKVNDNEAIIGNRTLSLIRSF